MSTLQVTALSNIEAKKKFEFLESVSGMMDAHLRYFKQGYELLLQMEPYIHQVLTFAQQSRERANYEQAALADRMQEFRRQMERDNQRSFSDIEESPSGDGIHAVGRSSHKLIEAVMQSTPRGKVQTIKQGYLLKRSSSVRGDWKRRFFVLDSRGILYYYRKHWGKPTDDKTIAHDTVNLLTSTIKFDAEQTDLRFCFRIISPTKSYTLQAESAMDRVDWIDKITGVIASLLNSQIPIPGGCSQRLSRSLADAGGHQRTASESSSVSGSLDFDPLAFEDSATSRNQDVCGVSMEQQERPIAVLRRVPGNYVCADCSSPDPDWASLNLGILLCIECSGVHRNLGVHISKVRSLTLDVKVWEPSVISLFQSIGNSFANSIWEEELSKNVEKDNNTDECVPDPTERNHLDEDKGEVNASSFKPHAKDPLSVKEKYIHAKGLTNQTQGFAIMADRPDDDTEEVSSSQGRQTHEVGESSRPPQTEEEIFKTQLVAAVTMFTQVMQVFCSSATSSFVTASWETEAEVSVKAQAQVIHIAESMETPVHLSETMQSSKPVLNAQEQVAETPVFQAVPVQPATCQQPIVGSNGQGSNLQAMQQVLPPPSVHLGYFGGGSMFQSMAGHTLGNHYFLLDGVLPRHMIMQVAVFQRILQQRKSYKQVCGGHQFLIVLGGAQTMMPNPMYGGIGMQPRFQSTQGQFGMPQANFGMAGITNQQPFVASPGQNNSGQGTHMNPNSVPMFQSLPYDNLTPLEKPTPYKGGKGVTRPLLGLMARRRLSFLQQFDKAYGSQGATFLIGIAEQWWTTLLLQGQAPSIWIYFKQIFASAWLSDDFEASVMTEWHQLNVASWKNLDDYNRKFWKALLPITSYRFVPLTEQIENFCCGLPKGLKKHCTKTKVTTLTQLIEVANTGNGLLKGEDCEFNTGVKEGSGKKKPGHIAPNCPLRKRPADSEDKEDRKGKKPMAGLVPDMVGDKPNSDASELCRAWGKVRDQTVLIFFDPGAKANFISPELASKLRIRSEEMGYIAKAGLACPGHTEAVTPIIGKLRLHIQSYVDAEEF
ncbi:hypothetical protein L7F22_031611 [Adiantum nelumboides]|nr:hypothetical protein [Adiantum nelumboides]